MELCDVCEQDADLMCPGCNLAVYCSSKCQANEWQEHQDVCWQDSVEHVDGMYDRWTRKRRRRYRRESKKRRKEERKDWWDRRKGSWHRKLFGQKDLE